jgi:hypothetical protein
MLPKAGLVTTSILDLQGFSRPVCLKKKKVNFEKMNYFLMFGSVMKNKLENTSNI